jgi:5-formyltetrahydrofolate cyclo-ligase
MEGRLSQLEIPRQELRQIMRRKRRALTPAQRHRYAIQFSNRFAATPMFKRSRHIAFYFANDGELDLMPLMHLAWSHGKSCYLPVLQAAFRNRLMFARYRAGDPVVYNKFGIAEPQVAACDRTKPQRLDLVLTPLVAFDAHGNRLGMGGGFYDRTFAYLRQRRYWQRPRLVGVAYSFQQVSALGVQEWDVPLQVVVTEKCVYF